MTLPFSDMRFASPLFFLLLIVVAALASWLRLHPRRSPAISFSSLREIVLLDDSLRVRFRRMLPLLRYAAIVLLILALARPQFGMRERQIDSYGVDIMLALDVSNSMQSQDFTPTRLEAAKRVVNQFVDQRQSDRIGVVIFGDAPFTLVPLTLDYGAIKSFVSRLTIERLGEQNTALGKGLANAVNRLKDSTARSKVIVLLTDGVDTVGGIKPLDAAKAAQALGIKVYTIGVGSNSGGDSMPGILGQFFMRQTAEFDEGLLQQIALTTNGKYYHAQNERELASIYDEINRMEKTRAKTTDFVWFDERMAWLAVPALLLLALEMLLRNTLLLSIP